MQRPGPADIENRALTGAGLTLGFFSLRVLVRLPIENPLCDATWAGLSRSLVAYCDRITVRHFDAANMVCRTKQLMVVGPVLWYSCKTFSSMGDEKTVWWPRCPQLFCGHVNPSDPDFCVGGNDGTKVRHNQTMF
jgi:hypothetical protein